MLWLLQNDHDPPDFSLCCADDPRGLNAHDRALCRRMSLVSRPDASSSSWSGYQILDMQYTTLSKEISGTHPPFVIGRDVVVLPHRVTVSNSDILMFRIPRRNGKEDRTENFQMRLFLKTNDPFALFSGLIFLKCHTPTARFGKSRDAVFETNESSMLQAV